MTNPFLPAAPQQPQQGNPFAGGQPSYTQQPQQAPTGYAPAPAAQYGAPAQNGGSPFPAGSTPAPGLVAQPGQFLTPPPPSEGGSANMPKIGDLQGRLLIVMPEKIERQVPGKFGLQDRITATVVVLDGGPLQWGGTQPGSQRQQGNPPYVIKGLWIAQSKLVEQLTEALNVRLGGGPGLALGRLWKAGQGQNDPYVLAAAQPADVEAYNAYVTQVNPFAL